MENKILIGGLGAVVVVVVVVVGNTCYIILLTSASKVTGIQKTGAQTWSFHSFGFLCCPKKKLATVLSWPVAS